jgi:hypothetical protein
MYHVLHDFMLFVKGSGYVIAGIGLLSFVAFWFYLQGGEGRRPRGKRPRVTK